ncbi:hypothetical protein [Blastococcus sp. SYSU DS0541]
MTTSDVGPIGSETVPHRLTDQRGIWRSLINGARDDLVHDEAGTGSPDFQRELADGIVVDVEDRVTKGAVVLKVPVEAGLQCRTP